MVFLISQFLGQRTCTNLGWPRLVRAHILASFVAHTGASDIHYVITNLSEPKGKCCYNNLFKTRNVSVNMIRYERDMSSNNCRAQILLIEFQGTILFSIFSMIKTFSLSVYYQTVKQMGWALGGGT